MERGVQTAIAIESSDREVLRAVRVGSGPGHEDVPGAIHGHCVGRVIEPKVKALYATGPKGGIQAAIRVEPDDFDFRIGITRLTDDEHLAVRLAYVDGLGLVHAGGYESQIRSDLTGSPKGRIKSTGIE